MFERIVQCILYCVSGTLLGLSSASLIYLGIILEPRRTYRSIIADCLYALALLIFSIIFFVCGVRILIQ